MRTATVTTAPPLPPPIPTRRGLRPAPPPTTFEAMPLVLTLPEFAAIYRLAISTVRKRLYDGTLTPAPFVTRPYRWRREDVLADIAHRGAVAAARTAERADRAAALDADRRAKREARARDRATTPPRPPRKRKRARR